MFDSLMRRLEDRAANKRSRHVLVGLLLSPTDWERTGVRELSSEEFNLSVHWEDRRDGWDDFTYFHEIFVRLEGGIKGVPEHSHSAVKKVLKRIIAALDDEEHQKVLDDFDEILADHVLNNADKIRKAGRAVRLNSSYGYLDDDGWRP